MLGHLKQKQGTLVVLKTRCTFESSGKPKKKEEEGEKRKVEKSRSYCVRIQSDSLGIASRHQYFKSFPGDWIMG